MSTPQSPAIPEAFPDIRTAKDARLAKARADEQAGKARRAGNSERFFYWVAQANKAKALAAHLEPQEREARRENAAALRNADRIFFELNPLRY